MKKLVLSIFLMMMSLVGSSQTVTNTSTIQLQKPIARLVIKDLIIGDALKEEISILSVKIGLLENKVILKDGVIYNLNSKVINYESILNVKNSQIQLSQELSKKLQQNLKKSQFKNKILGSSTGLLLIVGAVILIK